MAQIYLIGSSPYPRGLMKSTSVCPDAVDRREMLEHQNALRELNAFIAARHPRKTPVVFTFGRSSAHTTAMQNLIDQLEE